MSSKPIESPPPYEADHGIIPPQPAYSYYPDDEFQHFYRWSSPPGILKIMAVISIISCIGIFVCVASTLAYDTQGAFSNFAGIGGSYGGGYGGSYGGGYSGGYGGGYGSYGGGYGGYNMYGYSNYVDPRSGKGFMIAMAGIVFIFSLAVFIIIISRQSLSESRKFYLALIIICAILALLMLIASIVYLMAVNPTAQSAGSYQSMTIAGLCAPYTQMQGGTGFVNEYLYHYCVVEPQEAIAIVLGFVVTAALIIMLVFAVKTRQKILNFGKSNILWKKVKIIDDLGPPQDVEEWVKNVSSVPGGVPISDYPDKLRGSRNDLDDESTNYEKPPYSYSPPSVVQDLPLQNGTLHSSISEVGSSNGLPKTKRPGRPRRTDGQDYDTDYNSSGDELDDDDFDSEFPPIANEQERNNYKREFDRDHQEYKDLQAELDVVNKNLSAVDRELDELEEGSPQYLDALDEYNKLKKMKKSADYQVKKRRCKYLKSKLNHLKKMVSDYDRRT
ncbi:occludin [Archocentrus centrarchus]|uniref:occludin n=1 Tax=Archocentrus centrarchus TaxID=63155 RepID=UPI0011E9D348|nr:occludin-like [Archocentrus centrarchus]XP_030599257.1 occludin-like [Archocentrus centrarchus]XP_030599258.1 occludin-like [Archocentrus centrarchus]XP_030599259.1 occludin-like [Archocentrus centrarchus]